MQGQEVDSVILGIILCGSHQLRMFYGVWLLSLCFPGGGKSTENPNCPQNKEITASAEGGTGVPSPAGRWGSLHGGVWIPKINWCSAGHYLVLRAMVCPSLQLPQLSWGTGSVKGLWTQGSSQKLPKDFPNCLEISSRFGIKLLKTPFQMNCFHLLLFGKENIFPKALIGRKLLLAGGRSRTEHNGHERMDVKAKTSSSFIGILNLQQGTLSWLGHCFQAVLVDFLC